MFSLFKSDPTKKLNKQYSAKLEQAMHAQRNGDIRTYSMLTEQAQIIIIERTKEFAMWMRSLDSVDLIRHYRNDVQTIKSELVEKAVSQLSSGKDAEKVILELANKLTNRLMHAPTRAIQDAAKKGEVAQLNQLKKMLGIDQE